MRERDNSDWTMYSAVDSGYFPGVEIFWVGMRKANGMHAHTHTYARMHMHTQT